MDKRSTEVLIVGAGMTGLALGLALADEGVSVELLEPQELGLDPLEDQISDLLTRTPEARVSALTLASEQLLRNLGVWGTLSESRAEAYTDMHVWDGETRGEIHFSADDLHEPYLGQIVENRLIVLALLQRAVEHPDIRLTFGVTLKSIEFADDEQRCLLSDDSTRECQLVVGADGAHSSARRLGALGTHEWDYGHHAIVATLRIEGSHQHCCWQRFTEDGPLALLPLESESNDLVSLVWSTSPENAERLYGLADDELATAITRASDMKVGKVIEVASRTRVPLRQRHAQRYVRAGLALVGDAAHTIHPLAGQGVNLGFQDVAALVEVLSDARERREFMGSERVLRRYQRRQMPVNLRMSALMQGFKTLFTPQPPIVELARSIGMRAIDQCGPVKQHLMQDAMGLRSDLPKLLRRPLKI